MTTTTEKQTIKITLSERRPVTIDPAEWPRIASADHHDGKVASQANHVWYVRVRQHTDGRRLVYGAVVAGPGGTHAGWRETYAGYIVDARDGLRDGLPDDTETVRAIRRVAGVIDRDDLGAEAIGDLPAESI